MVAVLATGPGSVLSHDSGAELWQIRRARPGAVAVSIPGTAPRSRPGVVVHRRRVLPAHATVHRGVPVTTVSLVLVDLATQLPERHLEAAVNQADALDLLDPPALRASLGALVRQPGVRRLRAMLDRHTFRLTDSELERMFLRLVRRVGLPMPATQRYVDSWRVDFVWGELGLVVETDSLRYHRTPATQARDYARDHAHRLAGLTPLRFTHYQVAHEPRHVVRTLEAEIRRLRQEPAAVV